MGKIGRSKRKAGRASNTTGMNPLPKKTEANKANKEGISVSDCEGIQKRRVAAGKRGYAKRVRVAIQRSNTDPKTKEVDWDEYHTDMKKLSVNWKIDKPKKAKRKTKKQHLKEES